VTETPRGQHLQLGLAEMIGMLGMATDLGVGLPNDHTIRTSLLSVELGRRAGLSQKELTDTFYLTLLKMLGCTAGSAESAAFFTDEVAFGRDSRHLDYGDPAAFGRWVVENFGAGRPQAEREHMMARLFAFTPERRRDYVSGHCEVAQMLASRLGFSTGVVDGLAQVFERWDGQGAPEGIGREDLSVAVRIMTLANELEVHHEIGGVERAVAVAEQRSGGAFDPALVDLFRADPAGILGVLEVPSAWSALIGAEPGPARMLGPEEIEAAGSVMSDFADLKSVYTAGHSTGVATLAAAAASEAGLPPTDVAALRFAAHGHDLGRVAVTTSIWDKPGPLGDSEWERVRLHAYHSERILCRPVALASVANLAGRHHERLDGSGYHRGAAGAQLTLPARILAAADCFQALTQERAHRPAMHPDEAERVIRREVASGRLNEEAVAFVLRAAARPGVPRRRAVHAGGLTAREAEVLRAVAQGRSIAEAARELHLAPKTVDFHLQNIYSKAGVRTRAAATLFAIESGILET
jgi:HD-GYP domain-containing protein (c-di-GMP phosphodiesterase class II)/DNA-binding CsgD family transcriptional regulator